MIKNDPKEDHQQEHVDDSVSREAGLKEGRQEKPAALRSLATKKGLGADELNFAEFPLAVFSRRLNSSQKTLEFEDEVFDFGYSSDGQLLAVTRGGWQHDVVLISDLNFH